jgi:putative transcriptional regulator
MARNAWLNVSADAKLLFDTPLDDRWREAGKLLGVNLMAMSGAAGRA